MVSPAANLRRKNQSGKHFTKTRHYEMSKYKGKLGEEEARKKRENKEEETIFYQGDVVLW